MDRQVVGSKNKQLDLGSEVNGSILQIIPGISLTLHFLDAFYISYGIGYGIRNVQMEGNIYLTEDNIPEKCRTAVDASSTTSIMQSCENHKFKELVLTTSLMNIIDIKMGNFLIRYTESRSNSSGDAKDSDERQSIDEHDYQLAIQTISLSYILRF